MSIEVDPLTAFVEVDVSGDVVEVEVVGQGEKGDPGGGAFDGDASDVPYTPATEGDWDPVPAQVAEALDELAAGGGGGAVDSVNGQTGAVVLDAGDVGADPAGTAAGLVDDLSGVTNAATARSNLGLGNVDNTSDANKPVSSAQQTALDGKAATSHSHSGADITSGTVATARLGSGTANSTTFLRGDQTWATPSGDGGFVVDTPIYPNMRVFSNLGTYTNSSGHQLRSANRRGWWPVYIAAGDYDRFTINVTTAGVSTLRFGLHTSQSNGWPTATPMADFGTIDTSTTGQKDLTISLTGLAKGWYWVQGQADSFTSMATLTCVSGTSSGTPTVPPGLPTTMSSYNRGISGFGDTASTLGALGDAPSDLNSVSLFTVSDSPRTFFWKA